MLYESKAASGNRLFGERDGGAFSRNETPADIDFTELLDSPEKA